MTLGFPTEFQFFEPWFLNFSPSHFSFSLFSKLLIIALSVFFPNFTLQLLFEPVCNAMVPPTSAIFEVHFFSFSGFSLLLFFSFFYLLRCNFWFLSFSPFLFQCLSSISWGFSFYFFPLCFFWSSMVSSSEVRIGCPSISFLFARLGGVFRCFPASWEFCFWG